MDKKILVAYFSCTGRTERAAKDLAAATGADLYEIAPAVPYTRADLNWTDKSSRSTTEAKDPSARPALGGRAADIAGHDVIFVGFPIWWYTAPKIVDTFLESYDFSGKTVVPFATSGGSGMGRTSQDLKAVCPAADVREGRVLGRYDAKSLKAWAEEVLNA